MERFTCDPTHRSSLVFDRLCCETSSKRWLLNWVQTRPFPEPQWTEGKILLGPEISQFTKKPCEQELNILIPCKNQPFQKVFQQKTSYRIRTTTIQVKYWGCIQMFSGLVDRVLPDSLEACRRFSWACRTAEVQTSGRSPTFRDSLNKQLTVFVLPVYIPQSIMGTSSTSRWK